MVVAVVEGPVAAGYRNYFPLAFTPGVAGVLPLWQTACHSQTVAAHVARAHLAQTGDLRPRPPPKNASCWCQSFTRFG